MLGKPGLNKLTPEDLVMASIIQIEAIEADPSSYPDPAEAIERNLLHLEMCRSWSATAATFLDGR